MKYLLIIPITILFSFSTLDLAEVSQDLPEETWFDFWLGKWDLSWEMADGKKGKGTNHILKILDGKVIQENFEATDAGQMTGFKGMSLSTFNPQTKTWNQAWADNQGGYFSFKGIKEGDKRIFMTDIVKKDDVEFVQRMVFYDITANSLTWDWESSKDGGKEWKLNWRINYVRAKN